MDFSRPVYHCRHTEPFHSLAYMIDRSFHSNSLSGSYIHPSALTSDTVYNAIFTAHTQGDFSANEGDAGMHNVKKCGNKDSP